MLAEDSPDDQRLTLRALKKALPSVRVELAQDGEEALRFLQDATMPCPALAMLDVKMPKLNGLEVAQAARKLERCRGMPIVILTSSDEEQDVINAYRAGANSFVQKPIDAAWFMDTVAELGLYWIGSNTSLRR